MEQKQNRLFQNKKILNKCDTKMNNEYSENRFSRFKKLFIKFWRSDKGKISLLRDIVIAIILVLILLTALWAYTGQWFGAPMVAIESGSMEHQNEPYGRFGTINAGDMVLLVKVNKQSDIETRGSNLFGNKAEKNRENIFYGDYGDVIIYHPYGDDNRDQIIHRAICWIEYNPDGTYTIEEYGLYNQPSVNIDKLGLVNYQPSHSGFITKGDNNEIVDQRSYDLCLEPIKVEWVSGKGRGEIPWIGTINLLFNDLTSGSSTVGNVHGDCLVCLGLLIGIVISIPVGLDIYDYYKEKKQKNRKKEYSEKKHDKKDFKDISEEIDNKLK